MGQVLHGSATTTEAIRRAIQHSKESLRALSRRYGVNQKDGAQAVKRYHYDDHDQLRRHLADFVAAYNFARRLKTLKGLTPFEFVSKCWTSEPDRFTLNPLHQMPGLNS